MKKVVFRIFIFILLLTTSIFAKDKICLTNGEWPPYLSKKLPYNGFASHIVKEAFNAVDIDVEYIFLPWKRAYIGAKLGFVGEKICHGTLGWVYTSKRAEDFIYSEQLFTAKEVLYSLKSNSVEWNEYKDLKGKRIGGLEHTVYPALEEAERKGYITLEKYGSNYSSLFRKLLAYRFDATPQIEAVGNFFLRTTLTKNEQDKITYSPTVLQEREYFVIFSKLVEENERYLKLFNKGLRIIKDNGIFDELSNDLKNGVYDKYSE